MNSVQSIGPFEAVIQGTEMYPQNIATAELRNQVAEDGFIREGDDRFVVASFSMRKLLDQVSIVGPHLRIATIEGESGAGKHALSRLLYQRYAARHPEILQWGFIRCDARSWLLSRTDPHFLAGFVFLDRVDLLAAPGQDLLLRSLKEIDFRQPGKLAIVASSESSICEISRNGRFLTELALRLTSVRLPIPPLRERKDDIIPLANLFLERHSASYHLPPIILTAGAVTQLLKHPWPGNLRELSSILESAVIECSNGIIRAEDLAIPAAHSPDPPLIRGPEPRNLDAVIHHHILHVLHLNRGNKLRAARQLGISRSTLYRLLEKGVPFTG